MSSSVLVFAMAAQMRLLTSHAGLNGLQSAPTTISSSCHESGKTNNCPADSNMSGYSMVQMRRSVKKEALISTDIEDDHPNHHDEKNFYPQLVNDKFELCRPSFEAHTQRDHDLQTGRLLCKTAQAVAAANS